MLSFISAEVVYEFSKYMKMAKMCWLMKIRIIFFKQLHCLYIYYFDVVSYFYFKNFIFFKYLQTIFLLELTEIVSFFKFSHIWQEAQHLLLFFLSLRIIEWEGAHL